MQSLSGIAPEGLFPTGQRHGEPQQLGSCGSFLMPAVVANVAMAGTVTIASVRTHGVRLALYADGELTCDRITASSAQHRRASAGWCRHRARSQV